ncbi:Acyl_transf_3 domain-containing protein [Caenorhabditis elegans]|uniref:Acyl_transf_3 domain-containing protein n=1 Tax=Caenorhabditis elegans TaxID=6239 RepID=U4PE29_CAEEL|nr:Acyl_transf_3 domain-containing protein [Caenorhabditis elegans]CDH93005.1 Acyl_transf_3 domain-containing protein [Caenorhabditis elegans]|eukprot:NP_001294303.1 O-ACyltransferase homolog [Caenorhabditis elegans]
MISQKCQIPSKRLDLQGIRGIAIIVVLGFHFYPEVFPNGYLGVDQFFVLSGFLMCMLLKRAENQSPYSLVTIFYSRRFKRILPLYLLIILISMICLYKFFPDTAIESNQKSAVQALLFMSNRPKTVHEDYFSQLALAVDIFTHTWSLSVEIQFYFLVPLIFLISKWIPKKNQYEYYAIIGCLSYIFSFCSPDSTAFNSVFARIWQFLIGMVVYTALWNIEDQNKQFKNRVVRKIDDNNRLNSSYVSYFSLAALLFITAFPYTLKASIVRPLVTVGTGCLMLISEDNVMLSNKVLTYIGDISYSLYLIHWPIYAYWKLTYDGEQYLLFMTLVTSIALAILVFETFEKWYLKLSSTSTAMLIAILFVSSIIVIKKDEISNSIDSFGKNISSLDNVTSDMTVDDATKKNYQWNINDVANLIAPSCEYETVRSIPMGWCRHKDLKPSGKYKIAMIGNSWTANHASLVYQECGYQANSILQGSFGYCEVLYPTTLRPHCHARFIDYEQRIRSEKPDYAFVLARYFSVGSPAPKNVTSFDDDPFYQVMKEQTLKLLSSIKHKMYILDAFPSINDLGISQIAPMLKDGTDRVVIDKFLLKTKEYQKDEESYQMARKRYAQLVKDCNGRCVLIDYAEKFYNATTGTYRLFDEKGFTYFTSGTHLSPHGVEHVRNVWTDICAKL